MTKEEYIKKIDERNSKDDSWVLKLKTIDYHDNLKYYIGLEYDSSFPKRDWFDILLKVYKDNSEPSSLMTDVRIYDDYVENRMSNDEERELFIEELYKRNLDIEYVEDCCFMSYKLIKKNKQSNYEHTKLINSEELHKQLYESYKNNMAFYNKPILPYNEWFEKVLNTNINNNYEGKL